MSLRQSKFSLSSGTLRSEITFGTKATRFSESYVLASCWFKFERLDEGSPH